MKRIALIVLILLPFWANAVSLRLEGDRVWLKGDGAPLSEILTQFEKCGVKVLLDPALESEPVQGEWVNAKADRVAAQLAGSYNYLLEWSVIKGPLGRVEKLSSIRIFTAGRSAAARPISSGKVLDVVENDEGLKYIRGEILVAFREGSTEADLRELLNKLGGTLIEVIDPPGLYRIRIAEGMSVEEALAIVAAMDFVEASEPNLVFSRIDNEPVLTSKEESSLNRNVKPGKAVVAVLDSGLDPSYADAAFVKSTYNALNPLEAMSDPSGHGTLTSLVASGAVTPVGAAPSTEGVSVVVVRVFDENGLTSSDVLMRAMNYVIDADVQIVSMSWGTPENSGFIETTVNYAASEGITLYASAGNDGTDTDMFPSKYDSVIAVGGLDGSGNVWENSNYGDHVQLYKPAIAVVGNQTSAGTSISSPLAGHDDALSRPAE